MWFKTRALTRIGSTPRCGVAPWADLPVMVRVTRSAPAITTLGAVADLAGLQVGSHVQGEDGRNLRLVPQDAGLDHGVGAAQALRGRTLFGGLEDEAEMPARRSCKPLSNLAAARAMLR